MGSDEQFSTGKGMSTIRCPWILLNSTIPQGRKMSNFIFFCNSIKHSNLWTKVPPLKPVENYAFADYFETFLQMHSL